jgi:hypothetical protein
MKRLLSIAVLFAQLTSYAQYQVQKGRWSIGHTIGGYDHTKITYTQYQEDVLYDEFTTTNSGFRFKFTGPDWGSLETLTQKYSSPLSDYESKNSYTSIWLQPQIGYFIKDNLMIGANLLMGYSREKYTNSFDDYSKGNYWELGLGPIMKYYFGKNIKRKPFAGFETRFEMARGKEREYEASEMDVSQTKGSNIMVKPFAGYALFLGKHWTADVRVEYTYRKHTEKFTDWHYVGDALETDYPKHYKLERKFNTAALSFGIGYTF